MNSGEEDAIYKSTYHLGDLTGMAVVALGLKSSVNNGVFQGFRCN